MDEVLSGGITNAGAVVRRGETVDRPAQAHAAAIHGRPLWDVAMAARYWVPVLDLDTAARFPPYAGLDPVRRLRILADGYGMSADDRTEVLGVIAEVIAVERADIAARLEAGEPGFVKAFDKHGGWATWDRLQAWLADQRATFLDALVR